MFLTSLHPSRQTTRDEDQLNTKDFFADNWGATHSPSTQDPAMNASPRHATLSLKLAPITLVTMITVVTLLIAMVAIAPASSAQASSSQNGSNELGVQHSDAQVNDRATTVVRGTVTGLSMIETRDGRLFSISTITVDETLQGPVRDTVRVLTEGGRADDGTNQSSSAQAELDGGRRYQLHLVDLPDSVTDEVGITDLGDVLGVVGHDGAIELARQSGGITVADSDASGDFATSSYTWPTSSSGGISISINEASAPVSGATTAIISGLNAWINQTGPVNLGWNFTGTTSTAERVLDGENVIFWGATSNPADTYLARTTVWYTSNGEAVEIDMQFNTDYLWSTSASSGRYDIQSVTTHEAGHAIGLNHVSAISEVMYPSQASNSTKRFLGSGDRNGVESLYGSGCNGLTSTITGTTGSNTINGTAGDDVITGGSGDDIINGLGGNDIICGAGGNDQIFGGDGDDVISGGDGNDKLYGGNGHDSIDGDAGSDSIRSEDGNDVVHGGDGNDNIKTGAGSDTVFGDEGNDTIRGNAGDDTIYGNGGRDNLSGDDGEDFLDGGADADRVGGGAGNDEVHGGDGDDNVQGRPGNDIVYGDAGDDTLSGNNGRDTLLGGIGDDFGNGGGKGDTVYGGTGNDHISGGTGNDIVYGNAGDDIVKGASGNDQLYGEDGKDTVDGGKGDDVLFGGAGNDTIIGGPGIDTLNDTSGTNTLDGGTELDTCTAGASNCELFA